MCLCAFVPLWLSPEYRHDLCLNRLACHFNLAVADIDINLRAEAEKIRLINARLDGEAGSRNDAPRIRRLKVVNIRAVAVNLFAD